MAFADFGPVPGSEVGARNGQERVECGPERAERLTGVVRRLPQEPPRTRGNRRDRARKNPNRERLGFHYWWRWAELNRRPKVLQIQHYMLSSLFVLVSRQHNVRGTPSDIPAKFSLRLAGRHRKRFRDNDLTSTSTDTSGFRAKP